MATDQAHEQVSAINNGKGGAIGVTEKPSALRRWMVAGPEIIRLAAEYEALSETKDANESTRHHEQTQKAFLKRFRSYKLSSNKWVILSRKRLFTLDTKVVAGTSVLNWSLTVIRMAKFVSWNS